jgi:molybdopterin synthase sulfur carrier subunit
VAVVYIPPLFADVAGGQSPITVEGATVRRVIDNLERDCPGIRERLLENGRLRSNIRVAVDGQISRLGLLEKVSPTSEIHFVAAVSGG